MNDQTHFTHTEVCTLIAHEAVALLDTVQTEIPQCVKEFRTALEAFNTVHDLGKDGEALLAWLDMEIDSAERFVADGVNLPNMIDMCRLDTVPDAAAQMDIVWTLFETAAMEGCGLEQRQALLNTARTITEMCGMDELLLDTLKPNTAKLAGGLDEELDDVHAALRHSQTLFAGLPQRESAAAGPEGKEGPVSLEEPLM